MTTSNDPDEIRRDIERTRADLSNNVNALADEANPKNIASRQVDKAKAGLAGLKEKVMGSDDPADNYQDPWRSYDSSPSASDRVHDAKDAVMNRAGDAKDAVAQRADDARQAVQQAPYQVKSKTRGNPLAAGLIAFGVGALVGGLMPASEYERRGAVAVKDKAAPLVDEAKQVAQDVVENVKPHAQQAFAEVKDTATDAAQNVKSEAQSAKDDVQAQAQTAKDNVQDAPTS